MKYLILVPDGCGDRPVPSLDGRTPLEAADVRYIDAFAQIGEVGLCRTIPEGSSPGSEAGNLSILGYDPRVYLTGRAPFEAAAAGIPMGEKDVAFRASLVTLEGGGPYENLVMKDHSAGEIGNEEAGILMGFIDANLGSGGLRFHPGVSYRGLMVGDSIDAGNIMEPHNILGRTIGGYLPDGRIRELMIKSYGLLNNHPLNLKRVSRGHPPANAIWLWGQGKRLDLPPLEKKYGVKGCMVAAVNLLKGIGRCAGMACPEIPGATGTLDTNYEGKAAAAVHSFENGYDFVFIHVEAPDECSHTGDLEGKIKSLEHIDRRIFKPVSGYLANAGGPYRMLILPDHMTPMEIRTHSGEPAPFVLFDSRLKNPADATKSFSEASGKTGRFFGSGGDMADYFFGVKDKDDGRG